VKKYYHISLICNVRWLYSVTAVQKYFSNKSIVVVYCYCSEILKKYFLIFLLVKLYVSRHVVCIVRNVVCISSCCMYRA